MDINLINYKNYNNISDTTIIFCESTLSAFTKLNKVVSDKIKIITENKEFNGNEGEILVLNLASKIKPNKIVFVGVGDNPDTETIRKSIGKAVKECIKTKSKSIDIPIENNILKLDYDEATRIISETILLSCYEFDKYKQIKNKDKIENINIIIDEDNLMDIKKNSIEGMILGETTCLARDLVNEPANIQTPEVLAEDVKRLSAKYGFEIEIYNKDKIVDMKMEAFLAVSQASDNEPKLIVMKYFGDEKSKNEIIGLVGKGITYDSGGLSLKPKSRLITMKHDMAGAASVIGAVCAAAKMKLEVNVVAVVAACDNLVSKTGYKPGDIINTMAGKTIEIKSTDAEGRLIIVDAINFIIEKEKATKILDIASLTGGARSTFDGFYTAVISNDESFYKKLENASIKSGEKIWRIPMIKECINLLKSDFADYSNTSTGNTLKMITAAMFISEFIKDKPWLHVDIAPTCWAEKENEYKQVGGTGVGVRNIYFLLKQFSR